MVEGNSDTLLYSFHHSFEKWTESEEQYCSYYRHDGEEQEEVGQRSDLESEEGTNGLTLDWKECGEFSCKDIAGSSTHEPNTHEEAGEVCRREFVDHRESDWRE